MNVDSPTTDAALLLALVDGEADDRTRELFRQRYRGVLISCCRGYGLSESEADALAEDLLARLLATLATVPSPSTRPFRETLRTLVADAVAEYRRQRDLSEHSASALVDGLSQHLTGEELMARAASRQVRAMVEPSHWLAFHRQSVEGRSAEETAKELQMGVGAALKAKRRVGQLLREAVEALREGSTTPGGELPGELEKNS